MLHSPVSPAATADQQRAISDTLRIPLAARALGDSIFPRVAVGDACAREAMARLGDDGALWLKDKHSVYGVLSRTRVFRERAQAFLNTRPAGHIVNIGCGLSHYFQWLDNGEARMTDADLPDVIAQRRLLLDTQNERHTVTDADLCQAGWWDRLALAPTRQDAPVFIMIEGVLMYLQPDAVLAILAEFGERAPTGSVLVFDSMCWLAAGRAKNHPSVRHTQAQFAWGPRRIGDLIRPHERLHLANTHKVMEGYGLPYSFLGPVLRTLTGVPFYAIYELRAQDPA